MDLENHPKTNEYAERIKKGEKSEEILQGVSENIKDAVLKRVRNEEKKTEEQKTIKDLEQQLNIPEKQKEKITDLEILKSKLEKLAVDYYFLTHQTEAQTAEKINHEGFRLQAGGLNTTMLFQGAESIIQSLEKMNNGESHRGSDGMIIIRVPKKEIETYLSGRKFNPDEFAEFLIEHDPRATQNQNIIIPTSYNLGIYNKTEGFVFNT